VGITDSKPYIGNICSWVISTKKVPYLSSYFCIYFNISIIKYYRVSNLLDFLNICELNKPYPKARFDLQDDSVQFPHRILKTGSFTSAWRIIIPLFLVPSGVSSFVQPGDERLFYASQWLKGITNGLE
jgi:hypothetical protein